MVNLTDIIKDNKLLFIYCSRYSLFDLKQAISGGFSSRVCKFNIAITIKSYNYILNYFPLLVELVYE